MKLNTEILPRVSLGGISLGERIQNVIARLGDNPAIQSNTRSTVLEEGLIKAYHNENGIITALSCNADFKGKYLNKLWPGMTVGDVIKNSSVQIAWAGFVQVDRIQGIGLSLPTDRDDFETLTDWLEDSHVFEELWVYE